MLIVDVFRDLNALLNEKPAGFWSPLAIPFAVTFLAATLDYYSSPGQPSLLSVVSFVAAAMLALSTHRLTILGPRSLNAFGYAGLEMRELSYLKYALVIEFGLPMAFMLPLLPGAFASPEQAIAIPWQYGLFVVLASAVIASRLCLTLPASAVDQPIGFVTSWVTTGPYSIGLFAIYGLIPLALTVPAYFIDDREAGLVFLATRAFMLMMLVFSVVLLSLAYMRIGRHLQGAYGGDEK